MPVDPAQLLAEATPSAVPTSTSPRPGAGARARRGLRGVLAGIGLPVGPGATEQAAIERSRAVEAARTVIRQATWTRATSVLIANQKGGTAKTPLSLVAGGVLASVRGGGVVIVEVSDDRGTLGYRAEGTPKLGLGELVRDVDQLTARAQVAGYTAPQTSFASVIGTAPGTWRPPLTYEDVTKVVATLDEHFEIRVMDSGNQPSSGAFRAAVETADVLVIPVMNAGDAAEGVRDVLRELRKSEAGRRLASTAIAVVMDDGRPQDPAMIEAVPQILAAEGIRAFHRVPYCPHIATRGEVTLSEVDPAAVEAVTMLAANIVRALNDAAAPHGRRAETPTTTQEN